MGLESLEDAAHIAANGHPRHEDASGILERAGLDVDDGINGGPLPSNTKVPNPLEKRPTMLLIDMKKWIE